MSSNIVTTIITMFAPAVLEKLTALTGRQFSHGAQCAGCGRAGPSGGIRRQGLQ